MKIKLILHIMLIMGFLLSLAQIFSAESAAAAPRAVTYYVSQSTGNDLNDGLMDNRPFKTVSKVNTLDLQPGDRVLFKCGDVWRADPLVIVKSGDSGHPITFGSYPAGCVEKPLLSGSQPISGWQAYSGNIYVADLSAGQNAAKFAYGINQLFNGEERLLLGRWPNVQAGYATIDSQPASNQIQDNELPAGDWSGAVAHIRGMRWYILNREVTSSSATRLTLGADADCWGDNCSGWGYFINNHLKTLDRDGEWYYDAKDHKLYLFSTTGSPANDQIEGSVVLREDKRAAGGIILGKDLSEKIEYITIENLAIARWYLHGISTPTNLQTTENHHLILQDNTISDVDGVGINLATWVYAPTDGRAAGWRGGYQITLSGNTIERTNQMGINTYTRQSTFSGNTIRDIGRIQNLGAAGMGCAYNASGGACTEDGDGIRVKIGIADDTGNNNLFTHNRLEHIAYNGMDVFGYNNTFENNVIVEACISKGDCGAVRTYGAGDMTSTPVHDLTFRENIIVDTIGNTEGCHENYQDLFGFGLYFDHYSRDITVQDNTIISSTVHGILFQNTTGSVLDNTLYNNGRTYPYAGAQVYVGAAPALLAAHSGNILYSLNVDARTLSASARSQVAASNQNVYFSPFRARHIRVDGDKTLAGWQSYSGLDASSVEHWFTLALGDAPRSRIFYNDTDQSKTFSLGSQLYQDLDQNPVFDELTLAPYQSQILIESEQAADLAVSMDLQGSTDTAPGAPLTYTITLSNQGKIAATQVSVTNPLPAEIINTSWEASPNTVVLQSGTRYTWEIDHLAVGENYTFTVTGQYSSGLAAGTPLLLIASASTITPEITSGNNQALLRLGDWQDVFLPIVAR
jgi:uncharacterized repeat protein (TIGR01451 family)